MAGLGDRFVFGYLNFLGASLSFCGFWGLVGASGSFWELLGAFGSF